MSGDVQPRKRKDKKKKKSYSIDESGEMDFEEARGTAALFGEGDLVMHSHHDHGTGGNICAKIVFFTLLSILISLLTLIFLENRGLDQIKQNELNEVKETRFAALLEGWLENEVVHDPHALDPEKGEHDDDLDDDDIDESTELEDIEHIDDDDHQERISEEKFISQETDLEPDEVSDNDEDDVYEMENDSENDGDGENDDIANYDTENDENTENEIDQYERDDDLDEYEDHGSKNDWLEDRNNLDEKPYDELDSFEEPEMRIDQSGVEEEEEYEKRQRELKELNESNVWLRLGVGLALIIVTCTTLQRCCASEEAENSQEKDELNDESKENISEDDNI